MSGGFFRGTSADQDTRFSNKQAKLLKSQKFAPELEHLVDMGKVKMDVMRPWIAKRVTELVGIEDEVLINFIYSLLEGKDVNGKEVQIQLTGFMERNTGKFMKELWSLLLSAQNNASGVPQQFLDAKEEETRKKKAETDRITNEIQRRKEREYQELEQEKKKADGDVDISRDTHAALEPSSKHHTRDSPMPSAEKVYADKNGSRGRNRSERASRSPNSADHSPLPRDRRSRSISRSFSNSRSYSGERRRSRSRSSPEQRGRSISSERARPSPVKRSITPRHKYSPRRSVSVSPPRRRRRSVSRSRRRSPSPTRYRRHSPLRRRSRSPKRRRSRSPIWRRSRSPIRRSPMRHRLRSPLRPRSPLRRRSPSPVRRRTPSHIRHRSPSPFKRRSRHSPLSPRRGSPTTVRRPISGRRVSRSPVRRRSRSPIQRRSASPEYSISASPVHHRALSPIKKRTPKRERMSPVHSPPERMRSHGKYSPSRSSSEDGSQPTVVRKESNIVGRRQPISSRSPRSDLYDRKSSHHKRSPSPRKSPSFSESPPRRSPPSMSESLARRSPSISDSRQRKPPSISESPPAARERSPSEESEKASGRMDHIKDFDDRQRSPVTHRGSHVAKKDRESLDLESPKADEKNLSRLNAIQGEDQPVEAKHLHETSRKVEDVEQIIYKNSGSEECDKRRSRVKEKRKHKRSVRHESTSDDDSSYDSGVDERKEAKRRKKEEKKEEKKLRKEEKRRRRDDRRRKKEERRAGKQKLKSDNAISSPSDAEKTNDGNVSDEDLARKEFHGREIEGTDSAKKLEIELREKALESLRAKKSIGH
ncbi:PREDICTED: serine/arginine repetitive matrix protein 1 isoform X5 [Ipomoea nil]|uniref:serine/arginine repetitive matrix protein 1 isoform X5 n=1 Tax=Ipomoea nil TaxID=35883 RepID=UPI000901B711|nr:PREDICTED: serine/arginine repetitive matrix protein 1 isoform X5 [Ipomoea nil]